MMNKRLSTILRIIGIALVTLSSVSCAGEPVIPEELGIQADSEEAALGPLEASGFIEAKEVSVVSEVGGRVDQVLVDEADTVTAGQIVVVLDDSFLQADRMEAQAAVTVANASLAELLASATEEEIAVAQTVIDEAEASLEGVQNTSYQSWVIANDPQDIALQIASTEYEIAQLAQQKQQLQNDLDNLRFEYDDVLNRDPGDPVDVTRQDSLLMQIEQVSARLAVATAQYDGAVRKLNLLNQQYEQPLAHLAEAHSAYSQVAVAEAQVELAKAQYDVVIADPIPPEIAIAEAQIQLAEANVALIDARIAQLTLIAPVDGVITTRAISEGETASPGVSLFTIANLEMLKLVVYIPETQIGRVRLSAPVDITIDSYPGETFEGTVVNIGREAEFTPRNVQTEEERVNLVFAVEIKIDNEGGELKPGMPADVVIETVD
ncbi:MAG: efflux RND transporter periplasmic adaptor subunit [Anaerolineae bacterium]|nr:efflux RND transporter periplasmic adaptor subunit [Anaerolineae bacterium]